MKGSANPKPVYRVNFIARPTLLFVSKGRCFKYPIQFITIIYNRSFSYNVKCLFNSYYISY